MSNDGSIAFVCAVYGQLPPIPFGLPAKTVPPGSQPLPTIPGFGEVIAGTPWGVFIQPFGDLQIDPVNYWTISLIRTPPGGAAVTVATMTTNVLGPGNWVAFQPITVTRQPSGGPIGGTDVFSLSITPNGFPPTLPSFLVLIGVNQA